MKCLDCRLPAASRQLFMFGQTFEFGDLAIVALLVLLEGILSIDNALVLALLAKPLEPTERKKALTYGLVGALAFRVVAIALASYLLQWSLVKLVGGGYLIYISLKHFYFARKPAQDDDGNAIVPKTAKFWPTVFVIELTDIAFAVDSIIAAIGVVGSSPNNSGRHPKLWVVMVGGFLGVILMRFAAVIFIKLLERFPRFETSAYLLVLIIGLKLLLDFAFDIDFQHGPAMWIFWILMLVCFGIGFLGKKPDAPKPDPVQAH
ncbi:MAG TPA: hypothetical protein VHD56_16785 [Tepidisphaeraceae bacterium]|nr:hypothetical protein [Tepidisphaeraceae bacterium]